MAPGGAILMLALSWGPSLAADVEAAGAVDASDPAAVPEVCDGLPLQVEALGGETFVGAFVIIEDDVLALSTRQGIVEIPIPVITNVVVDGLSYSRDAFLEGVRLWAEAVRAEALRTPSPLVVGGLSVLWAGAGPAALGDWDAFLAYTVLETSFIGAGAVMVANEQYGPLLPLAALDVLLHVWAGSDAVRESRRRRRRMRLATAAMPVSAIGDMRGPGVVVTFVVGGSGAAVSKGAIPTSGACTEPGLTAHCSFPY